MISKEMFCKALKAIQDERENNKKLEKALEAHLLEGWAVIKSSATYDTLIDLLKELFQDTEQYSTIEWWLFDNCEKVIYNNDKTICADVTKAEDLYDYLIGNTKSD